MCKQTINVIFFFCSEDVDDPQLVVDYVNEIYEYMRMMERSQAIKKDYLTGKIGKKVFVVLKIYGYRDENQCPAVSNPAF